jgi:hypothetical protein
MAQEVPGKRRLTCTRTMAGKHRVSKPATLLQLGFYPLHRAVPTPTSVAILCILARNSPAPYRDMGRVGGGTRRMGWVARYLGWTAWLSSKGIGEVAAAPHGAALEPQLQAHRRGGLKCPGKPKTACEKSQSVIRFDDPIIRTSKTVLPLDVARYIHCQAIRSTRAQCFGVHYSTWRLRPPGV